MYYNSIVDHYGLSKIIITIISIHACVYYTNSNTKLSMAQYYIYTKKITALICSNCILYHTAESNTIQ